ncbi:MAG: hypothetical protein EPN91_07950 [Salinibacterium sp.]|nr:MAG: hypothetical protein EPN91_07950 [Salinibacterium sp.]
MDLALNLLAKYGPKEIQTDARRASMAAARVAAGLIRAETPVGKTKHLRRSVRARAGKEGFAAAVAGPVHRFGGAHRHLVIRGHRIVTRSGIDTGRMSRANPFVNRATDAGKFVIVEAYKRELFRK